MLGGDSEREHRVCEEGEEVPKEAQGSHRPRGRRVRSLHERWVEGQLDSDLRVILNAFSVLCIPFCSALFYFLHSVSAVQCSRDLLLHSPHLSSPLLFSSCLSYFLLFSPVLSFAADESHWTSKVAPPAPGPQGTGSSELLGEVAGADVIIIDDIVGE